MIKELDLLLRSLLCVVFSFVVFFAIDLVSWTFILASALAMLFVSIGFQYKVVHVIIMKVPSSKDKLLYLSNTKFETLKYAVINLIILMVSKMLFPIDVLLIFTPANLFLWSIYISNICSKRSFARYGMLTD